MTNLSFEVQAAPARLTDFALQSPSTDVLGSTWQALGGNRYRATLVLRASSGASTNRTLLRLGFVTDASENSGLVDLVVTNVVALRSNALAVANTAGRPGRVVLVGSQPVLVEAGLSERAVYLHGRSGTNYVIEGTTQFGAGATWLPVTSTLLSNTVQLVPLPPSPWPAFYRARVVVETATAQPLSAANGWMQLRLSGQAGQTYLLECSTNRNGPWAPVGPVLLANSPQVISVPGSSTNVFCRLRTWFAYPSVLQASARTGASLPVALFGRPGGNYQIERSPNLGSNTWQAVTNTTLTAPARTLLLPASGNSGFYRAVER